MSNNFVEHHFGSRPRPEELHSDLWFLVMSKNRHFLKEWSVTFCRRKIWYRCLGKVCSSWFQLSETYITCNLNLFSSRDMVKTKNDHFFTRYLPCEALKTGLDNFFFKKSFFIVFLGVKTTRINTRYRGACYC